jgi:hypothetical protein
LTVAAAGHYAGASSMLSRFRNVGRHVAGLLVALLIGATALPPALHAGMDDLACDLGAARSAGVTRVDASDSHRVPLHCEVCHWLRSIRVFEPSRAVTPQLVVTIGLVDPPQLAALAPAIVAVPSSRGPPLS